MASVTITPASSSGSKSAAGSVAGASSGGGGGGAIDLLTLLASGALTMGAAYRRSRAQTNRSA